MQVDKEGGERGKGHKEFGKEVEVVPNSRFRTDIKHCSSSTLYIIQLGKPHA